MAYDPQWADHSWAPNCYRCARKRWDMTHTPERYVHEDEIPPFSVWGDEYTGLNIIGGMVPVLLDRFGPETDEDRKYAQQGGGVW